MDLQLPSYLSKPYTNNNEIYHDSKQWVLVKLYMIDYSKIQNFVAEDL